MLLLPSTRTQQSTTMPKMLYQDAADCVLNLLMFP